MHWKTRGLFFLPGRRRNDAETAARVIAAAASRSVLKHAFTVNQGVPQFIAARRKTNALAVNTRSCAPTLCIPVKAPNISPCIQATAAVASARTASCVESENSASQ